MNALYLKLICWRACSKSLLSRFKDKCFKWSNTDIYAALAVENSISQVEKSGDTGTLRELIDDGFLYAVPKDRRSIERRLTRKHGYGKMILPKNNIVCCDTCGNFHIVNTVCGKCYERVKQETEVMQEAIFKELKLDPIDKEVVVLYKDDPRDPNKFQGKRIIELEKERPAWFSKNLLAKDSGTSKESSKSVGSHNPQVLIKD